MFRIKAWIPAEVDPKEDMQYTREDAEKEKAQLEEMQPENIYETEEVGGKPKNFRREKDERNRTACI